MTQNRVNYKDKKDYYEILIPSLIKQSINQLAYEVMAIKEYDQENKTAIWQELLKDNDHFLRIFDGCLIEYEKDHKRL